jgi:diaminohydroxyphosphoribosylaminopyrimidine deaminase / 5-amino-6-(5-phosphoribosylamino)uracil reductase
MSDGMLHLVAKIMKMQSAEKYMHRCLQLALLGGSYTAPNPMVGAVVVHNDTIIGEGFHRRYGEAHAEPNAIESVTDKKLLSECTLFVNLEPCSHFGKTPPCANLIVQSGIPKVVIGTLDPNPKVSGRGIEIMREAGIEVITGILEKECVELNKRFFVWQTERRPWVTLKWAQTKDGFVDIIRQNAETLPLQISNALTRQLTHKVRSENQSIMVSTNTAVLDNPRLSVRNWSGKNPVRLVLDRQGRIPGHYHIFDDSTRTLIFTETSREDSATTSFVKVGFDAQVLRKVLKEISSRNIHSVLVEGGPQLLKSFIREGLWDEAQVEIADFCSHGGVEAPVIAAIPSETEQIDGHLVIKYINQEKQFLNL